MDFIGGWWIIDGNVRWGKLENWGFRDLDLGLGWNLVLKVIVKEVKGF